MKSAGKGLEEMAGTLKIQKGLSLLYPSMISSSSSTVPFTVTFSLDNVVCGVTQSDPGVDTGSVVSATISPGDDADNVTFDTDDHGRATVEEQSRATDSVTGDVTVFLKVSGVSPSVTKGDSHLNAIAYDDFLLETIPIDVVIPYAVSPPTESPCFEGDVDFINAWVDAGTVPADPLVPAGLAKLITAYATEFTVQVNDQFGDPLSEVYAGSKVFVNGSNANVTVDSAGCYRDPVGVWFIPSSISNQLKIVFGAPNPIITDWTTSMAPAPSSIEDIMQNEQ